MHSILTNNHDHSLHDLKQLNQLCNIYINNQTPTNAAQAESTARDFVNRYLINSDELIKSVINNLNVALSKNREQSANAEGELIDELRAAVDVIAPKNLVLTMQEPTQNG